MANNRIYLGCVECMEEGLADSIIQLAKYYPSTGWYPWGGNIEAWMERHSHYMCDTGCDEQGNSPFKLYFEEDNLIPQAIWDARRGATTSPADTSPPASAP